MGTEHSNWSGTATQILATSEQGLRFIRDYFSALNCFLEDNKWSDIFIQHVADEPFDCSLQDYKHIVREIRKISPGLTLIDAVCVDGLVPDIDINVLDCRHFETNRSTIISESNNKEIWMYTCALPGGAYCNRLLDIPLHKTRLLHWGNMKYGFKGYLHWGFNSWREGQDPYLDTNPIFGAIREETYLPSGDTNIVYPSSEGPVRSIRLGFLNYLAVILYL